MSPRPRQASSGWKQFLRLGEQLLDRPTAVDQVALIEHAARDLLGGQARVWLARPFYPLPGEPQPVVLPDTDAPSLVQQAFKTREQAVAASGTAAAVPLTAKGDVLGVLFIERPESSPFNKVDLSALTGITSYAAISMQVTRQVALKNWRSDQLALVRKVSAQIANMRDLDELCRVVTDLIQRTFLYDYVAIFTTNPDGAELRFRASGRDSRIPEVSAGIVFPVGEGMVGAAAASGEEVLSNDVQREARYRFIEGLPDTRSEISLPLRAGQQVLGVLDVQSSQLGAFHEYDLIVLRALADNVALAVEGARLHQDSQRREDQMAAVSEVTRVLNSILDLDSLLEEVVSVIHKRFGYPFVHIFTVHPGRKKIFYAAGSGARSEAFLSQGIAYDLDSQTGMIPWVARNGKTLLANDVSQEPRYVQTPLPPAETRSELTIPLTFGDEVLGVMDLQSDQLYAFSKDDSFLLESLADSIAVALRNATLYRSEQWRRQVAESYVDVASLVTANVELNELLERILIELEKNLPNEVSAIWLLSDPANGQPGTLQLAATHGVAAEQVLATLQDDQVRGWLDQSLNSDLPVVRQPENPYGPLGRAMDYPDDYSSISAPMRAGDRCLGAITLAHPTTGRYGGEARSMVAVFASYAAVAIQNAQFFRSAQQQAWVSTVLLQVAEATQTVNTVEELLATIARLTPLLLGIQKSATFLWDENSRKFHLSGEYGFEPPLGVRTQEEMPPALKRLRESQAVQRITDLHADLNLPSGMADEPFTDMILLPLLARGQVLGAILIAMEDQPYNQQPGSNQNLAILQGITHQTAVALENLRLLENRQEEAYVTAVLLQVAQAIVSQGELAEVLDAVEQLMRILVGIEESAIYLWEGDAEVFLLASQQQPDSRLEWAEQMILPGQFAILDEVMDRQEVVACPLQSSDQPVEHWDDMPCLVRYEIGRDIFNQVDSWLIGFPLAVKGEIYGVLVVKEGGAPPALRERRMEIINGIAQQISMTVQNEHLARETVERERLEKEIQLARQIQKTFLPNRIPQPEGWQIAARWRTARQVGGDFYDIFSLGRNRLGLVVADVADKGLPAALYMTVTRTLIRAVSQTRGSPARALERVNGLLLVDSPNSLFVTAVFAVLELDTGRLIYANAGHNRPLLRNSGGEVSQLPFGGTALGVIRDCNIQDHVIQLQDDDVLLLFTDGVTETFNPENEAFGDQRLIDLLASSEVGPAAEQIAVQIEQTLMGFQGSDSASDDRTMVVVRRTSEEDSSADEAGEPADPD